MHAERNLLYDTMDALPAGVKCLRRFALHAIAKKHNDMHNLVKWKKASNEACFRCSTTFGPISMDGHPETWQHAVAHCEAARDTPADTSGHWRAITYGKEQNKLSPAEQSWMTPTGPCWWPFTPLRDVTFADPEEQAHIRQTRRMTNPAVIITVPEYLQRRVTENRPEAPTAEIQHILQQMQRVVIECAHVRWNKRHSVYNEQFALGRLRVNSCSPGRLARRATRRRDPINRGPPTPGYQQMTLWNSPPPVPRREEAPNSRTHTEQVARAARPQPGTTNFVQTYLTQHFRRDPG